MKLSRKTGLIFWMLTLGCVPAWANNAPQPDGLFSIILIFPVAIIGFRLAGAAYTAGERKRRVLLGLVLALAVIVAMAGSGIAMIPLIMVLVYGCMRGVQIIVRGHGPKRVFIGVAVCLWTLFAVSDYVVSLEVWSPVRVHETTAVEDLRALASAEATYARSNDAKRYATIEQLRDARTPLQFGGQEIKDGSRIYDLYLNGSVRAGYRYSSTVDASGGKFLITAVPAEYEKEPAPLRVPGSSWLYSLRSHAKRDEAGQRSFAIDETGVIRAADLGTTRPVTRDEVEKWKPLQ
ncbi:MAG: hypothetical protein ABSA27_17900 [Terriglobales bacterium]|jgi:hypothetical protein